VTLMVYWMAIALRTFPSPGRYGDFSYGIYLYHFPIVQTMVQAGWFEHNPIGALVALLLVVAGLAVVSWFSLERRFLQRKPK